MSEPRWRCRVYCPDCQGDMDDDGCFSGLSELSEESFATREEAEVQGRAYVANTIWKFDVEQDARNESQ